MILYSVIITLSMALIALVNIFFDTPAHELGTGNILLAVLISTAAVIALDGLVAFLVRRLPERFFRHGQRCFAVSRAECRLYRILGVRHIAPLIPELGHFTGFHKNRVAEPRNKEYLERFILECNYGTVIHLLNAVTGPLILLIYPAEYALCIGIPIALVNAVLSLLPFMVLRYNTPKLESLYRRNLLRLKAHEQTCS